MRFSVRILLNLTMNVPFSFQVTERSQMTESKRRGRAKSEPPRAGRLRLFRLRPASGWEGASASGSGGCSLALVPAAGRRAVCLLLRRRHIVCVRLGERGYCRCRFHPRYRGNREPRSSGRAGEPRPRQQGAVAPHVLSRLPSGLSPLPYPLTAHSSRGPCSPSRLSEKAQSEAEGLAGCGWELAVRLQVLAGGRLDWAETKGQLGGGRV